MLNQDKGIQNFRNTIKYLTITGFSFLIFFSPSLSVLNLKKLIVNFAEMSSKDKLSRDQILSIVKSAEEYEKNSNQILEYTQEVKKMDSESKKLVLKFLWKIILSDDKSDIYENTLMRRICGLLYLPDKLSGEIKLDIIKEKK